MSQGKTPTLQGFTREFLLSIFIYRPKTGEFVRRVSRGPYPAGQVVGTVDGKGYLHVSVKKVFIRLHRLAWFLVKGAVPAQLDHRDNDKRNNRIGNLRPCTCRGNAGNASVQKNNTSGYRGVSFNARSQKWHAQIKINGKQTYLGRRDTPEEAYKLYVRAAKKHFGSFAKVKRA